MDIIIISESNLNKVLRGQENAIVECISNAYVLHCEGRSVLPHSTFLRFPNSDKNRIIALPAFLESGKGIAGLKWIASFPHNNEVGLPRASAILVLNSCETGFPIAIIEGSIVSAKRTAASAVLAARLLLEESRGDYVNISLVGCGRINHEVLNFLLADENLGHRISSISIYDIRKRNAESFIEKTESAAAHVKISIADSIEQTITGTNLISFATTSSVPFFADEALLGSGSVILHISLRDLSPSIILNNTNIVDDVRHVLKENTSLHLAEKQVGHHAFIRGSLAEIILGNLKPRASPSDRVIFSPFGLGVLDIALGNYALQRAINANLYTVYRNFSIT